MRILHIEDAAAVACILAKYQNLTQGRKSKVVKLDKYDKFGFYKFYKDYVIITTSEELFFNSILEESKKADIIHVHSKVELVPYLRNKYGKSKKIVLHYHGTDIRGLKNQKLPHRSRISDTAIRLIYLYRRIRNAVLLKKKDTFKGSIFVRFDNRLNSRFTSVCLSKRRNKKNIPSKSSRF